MKKIQAILLAMALMTACAGCGGSAGKEAADGEAATDNVKEEDSTAATMRLEKSEGSVTVADEKGTEQELREKLPLYSGYGIETQSASYSWFNLDDVKLAKMDENSAATIEKEDKNLRLLVDKGSLYFNITEPLEDDETFEIRTSTMTVGIRGTCGWVDADTNTVYILKGAVVCTSEVMEDPEMEITSFMYAHCEEDGTIWPDGFDATEIPEFVWEEMEDELFDELGLSPNREDLFKESEEGEGESEPEPEPSAEEVPQKETAYGSGTTHILGVMDTESVEFVYVDGEMTYAEYNWEGKGIWGGDSPNSIETQPFYGLTVEELAEKVENMGFTVTIN